MKKILASILAMLILISSFNTLVFANPVGFNEKIDYSESEYISDEMMDVLHLCGIRLDIETSRRDEIVSRWFVAFHLWRMLGFEASTPATFETLYNDLTSEHDHYNVIKGAVNAGYMQGDANGNFRANEPVTTKEAATVMLRVLGYQPYIAIFGEARALQQTNIMEGIPASDSMTQAMFMRMLWNMLNSPALRDENFTAYKNGDVDVEYVVDPAYLGFEKLYGIKHEMAILDGIQGSTLNEGGDIVRDGCIALAGIEYAYSGKAVDLFGYEVNYLYKEVDGKREIVSLFKSDRNDVLVLNYDEIDDFSHGVYTYDAGENKTKTVSINSETKVIYNNVANPSYDDIEMVPQFGSVTLINNDSDKAYDVVKVEDYEFYFSSSINLEGMKIYDNTCTPAKVLDLSDADFLEVWNGENAIKFDRIKKSNLLVVMRSSENSGYKRVNVETFKVANKKVRVTSVKKDSVTSATSEYPVWEGVIDQIKMGKYYNFFAYDGVVVMVQDDTTSGPEYAYLLNLADTSELFESSTEIAIVDLDGNYAEYKGAKKITIDGIPYSDPALMETDLATSALLSSGVSDVYTLSQPVRIDFNAAGEINFIDTYTYNDGLEDENSLQKAPEAINETNNYSSYSRSLYNLEDGSTTTYNKLVASVDSSTQILFVPTKRFEESSYVSRTLENAKKYRVDILGRDKNIWVADAVICYYDPETEPIGIYTRAFIISELLEELNEDGDIVYTVKGHYINQEKTYTCDEELYRQLDIGDIWKFEVDRNDKIITFEKQIDVDNLPARANRKSIVSTNGDTSASRGYVVGTLVHSQGSFVRVTTEMVNDDEGFDPINNISLVDNFYTGGTHGVYKYTEIQGQPTVLSSNMSEAVAYTSDPENPSVVIVNVLSGVSQIYIIEK